MTGFAFPEILVQIVTLFRAGEVDEAADVFYRAVPLMRFEFQEGIGMAIRKEVLRRRGALASAGDAAAGGALDATTREALDRVLNGRSVAGMTDRIMDPGSRQLQGMDLGLKGKVAMVGGASKGLGFAVAQALAAEGALVSIASRDARRDPAAPRRRSRARPALACMAVAADVEHGRRDRRLARRDGRAVRRRRPAVRQHRRAARRRGALLRRLRRGRTRSTCCCSACVRMVRLVVPSMTRARRRRDPDRHVVVGEGADPEPRAVERAARRCPALAKTLALELAATRSASTRSSPAASTPTASAQLDEINAQEAGHRRRRRARTKSMATIPLGRYGEPDEFGRVARVPALGRRVLHDRRDRAGGRRADQGRALASATCKRTQCKCTVQVAHSSAQGSR